MGEIGGGLPGERRIGRTEAFPPRPVAVGAGGEAARRIAAMVEGERRLRHGARRGLERHGGIISRDLLPLGGREAAGDPCHLRMPAPAVRIGFELAVEIADAEPGEPRGAGAVAGPVEAVAGEAGIGRPRIGAAQRDQAAVAGKALRGSRGDVAAAGERGGEAEGREETRQSFHMQTGTVSPPHRFRMRNMGRPPADRGTIVEGFSFDRAAAFGGRLQTATGGAQLHA